MPQIIKDILDLRTFTYYDIRYKRKSFEKIVKLNDNHNSIAKLIEYIGIAKNGLPIHFSLSEQFYTPVILEYDDCNKFYDRIIGISPPDKNLNSIVINTLNLNIKDLVEVYNNIVSIRFPEYEVEKIYTLENIYEEKINSIINKIQSKSGSKYDYFSEILWLDPIEIYLLYIKYKQSEENFNKNLRDALCMLDSCFLLRDTFNEFFKIN